MLDYFQPIPIIGTITTSGWGIGTSGPRDTGNGIEDIANWRYWDGKILKADDGKYHLFCSKWAASKGIAAWMSDSVSVHAVSDNVLGPYKEIGLTYSYQNGRGHNTTGLKLIDGTYAVVESAIVPGWIFTSSSLDGPFNYKGSIATDNNGINASNLTSAPSPNKRHFRDARAPTTPASPCDKRRYRTLRLLRPPPCPSVPNRHRPMVPPSRLRVNGLPWTAGRRRRLAQRPISCFAPPPELGSQEGVSCPWILTSAICQAESGLRASATK